MIKILSLFFSVYSPFYPIDVVVLRVDQGSHRYAIGLFMMLMVMFVCLGIPGVVGLGAIFLFYMTLHNVWTRLARRYSGVEGLSIYPIHPWLRGRVASLTGYRPTGTRLYEIHIASTMLKHTDNGVQTGLRVLHDAKQLTSRLKGLGESCSVVGTTYEGRFAELASYGAKRNLRGTVHRTGVCPIGSKLLYPKKRWDTFVWEIGD